MVEVFDYEQENPTFVADVLADFSMALPDTKFVRYLWLQGNQALTIRAEHEVSLDSDAATFMEGEPTAEGVKYVANVAIHTVAAEVFGVDDPESMKTKHVRLGRGILRTKERMTLEEFCDSHAANYTQRFMDSVSGRSQAINTGGEI